jgi:uncharacterized membrane protein YdbT with pleckstrin-like domain
LVAHTFKYILITVTVVELFADWAGRADYVTGHHLVERLGLVNTTETTYELSQVKSVVVQQIWLGLRFNYGTIKLKFDDGGKQTVLMLRDINNPARYKQYFEQCMLVKG